MQEGCFHYYCYCQVILLITFSDCCKKCSPIFEPVVWRLFHGDRYLYGKSAKPCLLLLSVWEQCKLYSCWWCCNKWLLLAKCEQDVSILESSLDPNDVSSSLTLLEFTWDSSSGKWLSELRDDEQITLAGGDFFLVLARKWLARVFPIQIDLIFIPTTPVRFEPGSDPNYGLRCLISFIFVFNIRILYDIKLFDLSPWYACTAF